MPEAKVELNTTVATGKLERFFNRIKAMFKWWDKKIKEALVKEKSVSEKLEKINKSIKRLDKADAKIAKLQDKVNKTIKEIEKLEDQTSRHKEAVARTISDSMRLLNIILSFQKETALVSVIQAAQQTLQTGIAINTLRIEASAALLAGRKFTAFTLAAAAVHLGVQFLQSQIAERRAKEIRDYTQGINTLRAGYVG